MASREPLPRLGHAAVGIGSKLYVWGGVGGRSQVTTRTFDVPSLTWEQPKLLQGSSMPDGLQGMAVTSDGRTSYSFGGVTGFYPNCTYHNTLFQITPSQVQCEELQPTSPSYTAPKKKSASCIVQLKDKLLLFGGWTGRRETNDLHVFDLKKRVWALQRTTGDAPPPLDSHTFTRIDKHRAVVFGGDIGGFIDVNDTYVLDMETWHWTKLEIKGKQPPARKDHATCCIAGPLLMVIGGCVSGVGAASDVWLLDVDKGVWSEVTLPVAITPRWGHSATVFGSGASFRLVVLFGGSKSNFADSKISETTLLLLELRGGSWQVTRVVKPDELGRPDESLREQMGELELSPQEEIASGVEQSLRKEQEKKTEAGKQVQPLGDNVAELQTQSTAASPTAQKVISSPTHSGEGRAEPKKTGSAAAATDEGKEEAQETDSAAATADSTHTGEGKAEVKETDSVAVTTALTDSTNPVVIIDLDDLDIGDKKLGEGGFGSVYEGKWKKGGGMTVAVKVTQSRGSPTIVQEVRVWGSLPHHRNIIALIGVASVKHVNYIVTELAVNGSLHDYLHSKEKKQKPSVNQSLIWASDVAHGMKHLHDHDIIHRDLKSSNVLLTRELVAKLCDFGSARELTHTITTEQTGTYRWMSPEIMRSAYARINKKCDLFSYGMILYELFAHETPYADLQDNVEVLLSVISGKRPPIPPTLPPYLHDLLKSCWEEDPHLRPTFDDFFDKIKTE